MSEKVTPSGQETLKFVFQLVTLNQSDPKFQYATKQEDSASFSPQPFTNKKKFHRELTNVIEDINKSIIYDSESILRRNFHLILTSLSKYIKNFMNESSFEILDCFSVQCILNCIETLFLSLSILQLNSLNLISQQVTDNQSAGPIRLIWMQIVVIFEVIKANLSSLNRTSSNSQSQNQSSLNTHKLNVENEELLSQTLKTLISILRNVLFVSNDVRNTAYSNAKSSIQDFLPGKTEIPSNFSSSLLVSQDLLFLSSRQGTSFVYPFMVEFLASTGMSSSILAALVQSLVIFCSIDQFSIYSLQLLLYLYYSTASNFDSTLVSPSELSSFSKNYNHYWKNFTPGLFSVMAKISWETIIPRDTTVKLFLP